MVEITLKFEHSNGTILEELTVEITPEIKRQGVKLHYVLLALKDQHGSRDYLDRFRKTAQQFSSMLSQNVVETLARRCSSTARLSIHAPWNGHALPWECILLGHRWLGSEFAVKRVVVPWTERSNDVGIKHSRPATTVVGKCVGLLGIGSEQNIVELWMSQQKRIHSAGVCNVTEKTEISREALLIALAESRWFHYAGHARVWNGLRALDPEDRGPEYGIGAEDIEKLPSVPDYVYLNGCGALEHRGDKLSPVGKDIGLALLQKGTKWLVGPTIPFLTGNYFDLIRKYYQNLHVVDCCPAEAMKRARKSLEINLAERAFALPLSLSTVVYGPANSWSMGSLTGAVADKERSGCDQASGATYPKKCGLCGQVILTHHGNYSQPREMSPKCRTCFHDARRRMSK
jgi:hypothetical protein